MKKITDEFTALPVSNSRKTQLRRLKKGLCRQCGRTRVDSQHCELHQRKNRDRSREARRRMRIRRIERALQVTV